jgi:hypothetical protein
MIAMAGACAAQAQTLWNESTQGDLADTGDAPTALVTTIGHNIVLGETGNPGTGIDRDYFSIFVPVGTVLSSLTLLSNTTFSGSSGFMAMQVGPQVTTTTGGGNSQDLLGFVHYDASHIGTDILSLINPTGPLASGTYSIWVQELGGTVDYGLDFVVTPVPLPAAAWLLISGLIGLSTVRRKRS